jgi:hypothetical protein
MRKCANNIFLSILLILIFIIANCVPSSYQSPRVLRPGEKAVGAGFALVKAEYVTPIDPFLCFRYGVFKKADLGLKFSGYPDLGYGIFFDTKYSFLEQPLLISGDLGFMVIADYWTPDNEAKIFGFHPTIFFGNEKIYGGIGWNYFIVREKKPPMFGGPYISVSRESFPRIMIGTSLGRRLKFNTEVIFSSYLVEGSSGSIVVGFGIRYVFFKKK